jgi:hypothetical protein
MIAFFKIDPNDHIWEFIIDNISLIREMEYLQTETQTAKWNLRPDADILNLAFKLLQDVPANYTHIKGHQDKVKSDKPLSFRAQMNIMADELATRQREKMTAPKTYVSTPYKHLIISDMTITRDSQQWIIYTASRIPIQQYYHDKYRWSPTTFQSINWAAQQAVLSRYEMNDQRRILKFVHGWLPTYDRLYREKQAPTQKCPLCHYLIETNLHLFQCRHPSQREIVQKMYHKLKNDKSMGEHEITTILIGQLQENHQEPGNTNTAECSNPTVARFVRNQHTIGWKHIFDGRIAKSMTEITVPGTSDPQKANMGQRWTKQLIQCIWDTVLLLWTNRNNILYNDHQKTQNERQRERLEERVIRCYSKQNDKAASDRTKNFYKERELLMQEDARYSKAWLRFSERIIKTNKLESKKNRKEKALMEQYFKWHPPTQRPTKRRKISHKKQDLKPD